MRTFARSVSALPRSPTCAVRFTFSGGIRRSRCPRAVTRQGRRRWPRSAGSHTSASSTTSSGACSIGCGPLEESLEYDSDDASLIRVTRHDWEKERRVPTELRTRHDPRRGARQPGLDRRAGDERLREVPPRSRAQPRPQAALRRVLRVDGLAVHAAPRRLRAVHGDPGGRRGVRRDPPGAVGARARGAARSTRASSTARSTPSDRRSSASRSSRRSGSSPARTGSIRPCTRSAPPSRAATSA